VVCVIRCVRMWQLKYGMIDEGIVFGVARSVGLYARKNYAHKGLHYAKPGGIEAPITIPSS
jgi:hypothetical protein